jgi:hypothetical protein
VAGRHERTDCVGEPGIQERLEGGAARDGDVRRDAFDDRRVAVVGIRGGDVEVAGERERPVGIGRERVCGVAAGASSQSSL